MEKIFTANQKSVSKNGFTLLEVMMAIAIIGIALTALIGSQARSVSMANEAKFKTMAALLAQGKMAEIESGDFENLQSDQGDFGEDFPDFYWEITVSRVALDAFEPMLGAGLESEVKLADYLKQVDLAVFWGEQGKFQYLLRFYTFLPAG